VLGSVGKVIAPRCRPKDPCCAACLALHLAHADPSMSHGIARSVCLTKIMLLIKLLCFISDAYVACDLYVISTGSQLNVASMLKHLFSTDMQLPTNICCTHSKRGILLWLIPLICLAWLSQDSTKSAQESSHVGIADTPPAVLLAEIYVLICPLDSRSPFPLPTRI
jgi:hypothetical protein